MNEPLFQTIQEIGVDELRKRLSALSGSETGNQPGREISGKSGDQPGGEIGRETGSQPGNWPDIYTSTTSLIPPEYHTIYSASRLFMEGVHFDPVYTPFPLLGVKMLVASMAPLVARQVVPSQVVISVAVPNKYSVQMIEELFIGIDRECKNMGIGLQCGDVTASHQHLIVAVHCSGFSPAQENKPDANESRQGVFQTGDLICVTGDLGAAIAGLRILLREKKFWMEHPEQQFQPDFSGYEYVVGRQLHPENPLLFLQALQARSIHPGMIVPITEGLIPALKVLLHASKRSMKIFAPAMPIAVETRAVADEMEEDADKYAYYGGEDYEFLFTIPDTLLEDLEAEYGNMSVIGEITEHDTEDGESTGRPTLTIHTGEGDRIKIESDGNK